MEPEPKKAAHRTHRQGSMRRLRNTKHNTDALWHRNHRSNCSGEVFKGQRRPSGAEAEHARADAQVSARSKAVATQRRLLFCCEVSKCVCQRLVPCHQHDQKSNIAQHRRIPSKQNIIY
ncbi:hypothetical protein DdX_17475 [Ditylenchus destructor]|uniref:Uncharacterized protein n=1 Tax=Ditylenchus destructor TaxID=166010 RepID=A0AAD4QZ43_9BILA|nr:hypothetical protein DdX_17475 [Ditylenchus destructor]